MYSLNSYMQDSLLFIEIRNGRNADNYSITEEIRRLTLSQHPQGILIDIRGNLEYGDATMLYGRYYMRKDHIAQPPGIPIAIVDSEERRDLHSFLEDIAANRGYNAKVFNGINAARAWLIQQIGDEG